MMKSRYVDDSHYHRQLPVEEFSYSIQSDIKEFTCNLCKGIAMDPAIDSNGDLFCHKCLTYYQSTHNNSPITNKQYSVKCVVKLPTLQNFILKQKTRCPNRKEGCKWEGSLKDNKNHVENECLKSKMICPNEGCGEKIIKEQLEKHKKKCHYRKVECEYCKIEIIVKERKVHNEICPEMIIECPQNCNEKIKRKDINEHIANKCENTRLKCSFSPFGCVDNIRRKDMETHMNESFNKHLLYLSIQFDNIREECINMIKTIKIESKDREGLIDYIKQYILSRIQLSEIQYKSLFNTLLPESNDTFYQDKEIFDLKYINKGIEVKGNRAKCVSNDKKRYLYLFSTIDVTPKKGEKSFKWEVILSYNDSFLGIGLCDKKKVLKNHLIFEPNTYENNHGTFIFSINGYTWNGNDKSENNKYLKNFPINGNQHIKMEYFPEFKVLYCRVEEFSKQMINVYPTIDDKLTMCFILVNPGDELEVIKY